MRKYFNVSHRMASKAKQIRKQSGYKSPSKRKTGRNLPDETVRKVKEFYLSDEISRMMPSKKDFIFIKTNAGRIHVQKRLMLYYLKDAYSIFTQKFSDIKMSCSKFSKMHPKEYISADKTGHNVC